MFKKYINTEYHLPDYNPDADFDWIKYQSGLPWLCLNIDIPYQQILKEIQSIQSLLVDHRDSYGEHLGWKSFCIHGKSLTTTQHSIDDREFHWIPEIIKTMPRTVEYFQSWGLEFHRLRVMALEPGGFVSIHTDTDRKRLYPINIAITQPTDCKFINDKKSDAFMLRIASIAAAAPVAALSASLTALAALNIPTAANKFVNCFCSSGSNNLFDKIINLFNKYIAFKTNNLLIGLPNASTRVLRLSLVPTALT